MSLLAPAFLAGLAALAIPLIVHLAYRSSGKPTSFPSLHFLRRIPFRTRRRRVLRHPLLFALRCGALALLVLAFARPVLPGAGGSGAGTEAREVVLLVDRSYSMGYRGRWGRALEGLREAVAGLAPGDRASLVAFDERAETVVPATEDPAVLRSALEGLQPGHGTTRYEAGFRIAGRILEASDRARRDVVLVTDFQAAGWEDRAPLALPAGAGVRAVDVSDPESPNLLLSDLTLTASGEAGRADVAVRVSNAGPGPAAGVEVRLELDGRAVGTRGLDLEPRASATVPFAGVALPPGGARATLRLSAPAAADGLAADDALRFHAAPAEALRIRVVEPGRGGADRSLYLRRALGIGGEPPVELERGAEVGSPGAGETALVVLNDADVGAASARALADFVEAGGGLLVALGGRAEPARWPEAARRLLPGRVGEVIDRVEGGGVRLATVEYGHPAFEAFRAPRSGDLSAARFLRYRRIEPDTAARVLARFDDGAPALVEGAAGEGRVLLWASSLDRSWNDLAVQPVYLPLLRRLAVHAAGWAPAPRARTVGEPLDVVALVERRTGGGPGARGDRADGTTPGARGDRAAGGREAAEWIVASPGGERRSVRAGEGEGLVVLDEPGFWEVRPLDEGGAAIPVAVNPDPAESDLTPLDREEFLAAAGAGPERARGAEAGPDARGTADGTASGPDAGGDEEPAGREVWWPLLLVATGLFVAEATLARRLDGRAPRAGDERRRR